MQRSFLKALLCAAGALVLAGAAFAQDTVKIGVTQPLTGAFADADFRAIDVAAIGILARPHRPPLR